MKPWTFNAATAFRPWRTKGPVVAVTSLSRLQCGHGVSAVENAICYRYSLKYFRDLQCGHGVSAVENAATSRACRPPARPFNAATAFRPWRTGYHRRAPSAASSPSMRPRRFGRGEQRFAAESGFTGENLQCGHGVSAVENVATSLTVNGVSSAFNAATAFRPWRTSESSACSASFVRLQCGHGVSAVENLRGHYGSVTTEGSTFNAATAFRPWRTLSSHRSIREYFPLQCGHGVSAVENPGSVLD